MLFTGKGDDGTTKTFGCNQQRISKSSLVPEALGALDELNAFLGFVKMRSVGESRIQGGLRAVQETLFIVQAEVAGADKKVGKSAVREVEELVNNIENEIPRLKGFPLLGELNSPRSSTSRGPSRAAPRGGLSLR